MLAVPVFFGLTCVAACWVAAHAEDRDALLLARVLTVIWALANAAWFVNQLRWLPLVDWYAGMLGVVVWMARDTRWVRTFLGLIGLRLVLHVVDYLTGQALLVPYIHALNAAFFALLVITAYPGGRNAGDRLSRLVRRRRVGRGRKQMATPAALTR